MKLITTLHKYKTQFQQKFLTSDAYKNSLISLGALALFAGAIWFGGPLLSWDNINPLAQPEKRIYVIIFFSLIWLLKLLLLDLDNPIALPEDPDTLKKVRGLQSRFNGAVQFLKKTITGKNGKKVRLNQLPWCLLIGPKNAGKTSLLANSDINYILQRQFPSQDIQHLPPSEHCDWWITRDNSIIDVPGRYLSMYPMTKKPDQKPTIAPILWDYFLNLVRKQHGINGVDGIIIALPLPEIMKQGDTKNYQATLHNLFLRIHELQKQFPQSIPCYLAITKCDLLSGFDEFFAESSNEEIAQAWGITIPPSLANENIFDLFTQRFNALIKKLNQQLLWRMHQERNPMARPYIKDFPLQVERLKEFTLDFIKKFSAANFTMSLKGIYLTSSLQNKPEPNDATIIDEFINTNQKSIQLFKEPTPASRAYFIKQLITHALVSTEEPTTPVTGINWIRGSAYAASLGMIGVAVAFLGSDFQQGVKQTKKLQNNLTNYKLAIRKFHNPDAHLLQTIELLNTLEKSAKETTFKENFDYILSFYSHKSQQKVGAAYHQALQTLLIPEITNYFADYLRNPVNENTESVYAVLKAYLMLGDAAHFQPEFVSETMQHILPKSINENTLASLMDHLNLALKKAWVPQPLNINQIQQTRKYLANIPSFQLAYIILKNINSNNLYSNINLGINVGTKPVFVSRQVSNQVPTMFTGKAFSNIISRESEMAADEANKGNWVLGDEIASNKTPEIANTLLQQIRSAYVSSYVELWENMLTNIHLSSANDLAQTDAMIINLVSNDSPLLQLIRTLHDNTYFEPITSSSPKLFNVGLLVDKNKQSQALLYQIFTSLQNLHLYIQTILSAENEKKAAFEAISYRMVNRNKLDPMIQLRIVADKTPEPVKSWLIKIANDSSNFILQDATRYMDTSWQEQVSRVYLSEIANRYPFSSIANREVSLNHFVKFFGNPGIVYNFYITYLQPFVDTSTPEWRWKTLGDSRLPFSEESLRQVQQAMRIHQSFFPTGDNKLNVQFSLQPYQFGKNVTTVRLNINDKQILDTKSSSRTSHTLAWPNNNALKMTSLQLITSNQKPINQNFPGEWGWFRLVSQAFESASSHKQIVINFSASNVSAKYLLATDGQFNPFMSLNLNHFRLPEQLTDNKV